MTGNATSNLPDNFAGNLRREMWKQRVSIAQLSDRSGVSIRLISKYRAGDSEPRDYYGTPTANALKIARALEVPVHHLLPVASLRDVA